MTEEVEAPRTLLDFLKIPIPLLECSSGATVPADIVPLETPGVADQLIDQVWWNDPCLDPALAKVEADSHWKWAPLLPAYRSQPGGGYVFGWALQTPDGEVQGATILKLDRLSYLERSAPGGAPPAVYVDRLATAPKNRSHLRCRPGKFYAGSGTGLLNLAVAVSHYIAGEGRILLTSVPTARTIQFYKKYGLRYTGVKVVEEKTGERKFDDPKDTIQGKLHLMELPREAAVVKLRAMRFQ